MLYGIYFEQLGRTAAYFDSVQARLTSLRQLQSATGEELSALLFAERTLLPLCIEEKQ